MFDPRLHHLADVLIGYSTNVQAGEKVLIDAFDAPAEMVLALIRRIRAKGALPFVNLQNNQINRELLREASEDQYGLMADFELHRMKAMDAYVAVRGSHNIAEQSDVPSSRNQLAMRALKPVLDRRINQTRWVVLRWPHPAMAQSASMSTEAFEDFFFRVCTLDYQRLHAAMQPLKAWFDRTDQVEIQGQGTDLRFSIRDIPTIDASGRHNIPDGEIFTSPVRDSVEGHIQFNTPSIYQGTTFDSIRLQFSQGKIVDATANHTTRLNEILDSDDGARYIGEFAIGFNPFILEPMRDILFDEKIAGSFHFTPGQAYETADNGNRSQVHWDMVCIQRPEYGGGRILFDGELIRDGGKFIPADLQSLNPESFSEGQH